MLKAKSISKILLALAIVGTMLCASACDKTALPTGTEPVGTVSQSELGGDQTATDPIVTPTDDPGSSEEADGPTLPAEGTDYIYTMLMEGAEVGVTCKYVVSDIGFAVAYDPEFFEFSKGEDDNGKYLTVYSVYDDIENISNYASFRTADGSVDAVAGTLAANLAGQYALVNPDDITISERSCKAFYCEGTVDSAAALTDIYVVSLNDATSMVVEMHYTTESAEGMGARLTAMLDSIVLA